MAAEPKSTAGDDRVLPPEIWTEILIRLSAKSVLRCRSACKSWYSLISRPKFISDYSLRNPNKNGLRVLHQPSDNSRSFVNRHIDIVRPFSSHDEWFTESREHDEVPESFLRSNVEFVGTCNGLICLSKDESYDDVKALTFLIWNPTLRKVVEVPWIRKVVMVPHSCPNTNVSMIPLPSYIGFGFDVRTGDYKILCMRYLGGRKSNSNATLCEIFDLSKGVWRGISPLVVSWSVRAGNSECYLNGAVHWNGFRDPSCSEMILLSFDMSDEIFREIRMPDWNVDGDSRKIATLSVAFGGLIHLIAWKWNTCFVDMDEGCSIWAMKEYGVVESWTKLFKIDLRCAEVYQQVQPYKFHLWGNGEVLMVNDCWDVTVESMVRQDLFLYSPESRERYLLFSFTKRTSIICFYEESLALM